MDGNVYKNSERETAQIIKTGSVCINAKKLYHCKQLASDSTELFQLADESLFSSVQSNSLHLLPAKSSQPYNLRPLSHNFALSAITSTSDKCNFITRMLFHNAY